MNRRKRKPAHAYMYSFIDELMASTTEPLSAENRAWQLGRMRDALQTIESGEQPTPDDWRLCCDAVNMLETLTTAGGTLPDENGALCDGWWLGCDGEPVRVTDASGMLQDAITALATAAGRKSRHGSIRLDGPGIKTMRAVLDDYADLLAALPARTTIRAHRQTERRVHEISSGKKRPHDVEVVSL
jgi:hypothetical protein